MRGSWGCRPGRAQRDEQRHRWPLQPRGEMSQPAQRRFVRPMGVVDGNQQRPVAREVDGQPIEPMQHRKRRVRRRSLSELPQQERPDRAGLTRQEGVTLALLSSRQPPLEQLAHHPEGEADIEFRATRAQDLMTQAGSASARLLDERGLANAGSTLDENRATVIEQLAHCGQLALALKQDLHTVTLSR